MEQLKPLIVRHEIIFQSLVHQYKGKGKFLLIRMRGQKEPEHHVLTHIAGKNPFIDEKMKNLKENELLFLIRHKQNGIYLVLTEDQRTL